ncbi:MAG: zinc metallopeptidase [Anaerolineales bacterium]|nr:zinc metallopeptidase [Anaerolineales bacterium]
MFSLETRYLLWVLPMLLAWYAQRRVRQVYVKYDRVPNQRQVNGQQAAERLLAHYRLNGVRIERIDGRLNDHYDPRRNTLRLTDGVINNRSITALGIVAHEAGHAAQDADGYRFMRLRSFLANRLGTLTQFGSLAFIGGMVLRIPSLMLVSGVMLGGLLLFSLVTLPVERDASKRALDSLHQAGLVAEDERQGVRQVLSAAAFTYLASLGQRLGSFLFFAVMVGAAGGFFKT